MIKALRDKGVNITGPGCQQRVLAELAVEPGAADSTPLLCVSS